MKENVNLIVRFIIAASAWLQLQSIKRLLKNASKKSIFIDFSKIEFDKYLFSSILK